MSEFECLVCEVNGVDEQRIECGDCDKWFHMSSIGMQESDIDRLLVYYCDECEDKTHKTGWTRVEADERQKREKTKYYSEVNDIVGHRYTNNII